MTGAECVNAAMDALGVFDPGEGANTSEYTAALGFINRMINNLSLERHNIPVIETLTANLVTGTAQYTVGSGGSFSSVRPLRIERCRILVPNTGGSGTLEDECKLLSFEEWAGIGEKGAKAVRPTGLYYDYAYPVGTLNFWPTPTFVTIAVQGQIYVWQPLNSFPDTTTDIDFPQGYNRMIVMLSAIELSAMFSVAIPPAVQSAAMEAKAALRALNAVPQGQPAPQGPLSAVPPMPAAAGG